MALRQKTDKSGLMKRYARWALAAPATLAVAVLLIIPVAGTIATTFGDPKGAFAPYVAFFESSFRRTVLYRTIEVALATTVISVAVGFVTAYVVANAPRRMKSIL